MWKNSKKSIKLFWIFLSVAFLTSCGSPNVELTKFDVTVITDAHDVPMVLIRAGAFKMGSDADVGVAESQKLLEPFNGVSLPRSWFTNEEPVHTVVLSEFYIDQFEVTNARYAECVDAGMCDPLDNPWQDYGVKKFENYPVKNVSWYNATAYCEWIGARLPTEAEWEKAARGGLEGANYPWGNIFDGSMANFCDKNCSLDHANSDFDDGFAETAPVGSYPPNGYGLYDMAGNVSEWVADWYSPTYYEISSLHNPTGPETGNDRVLRSSPWYGSGDFLRIAIREHDEPSILVHRGTGIRCARSP